MAETKTKTIDITLIKINPEIYPRARVDEEVVESYSESMEDGAKFPPLTVQKNTYTLIDGFHRYHAFKLLGKEKVDVEILEVPETELRVEALRRNIKHGKRLTTIELRNMIVALRFTDGKSQKEIADIVGRSESRVSQICDEFREAPRSFNDFSSKVPKIDLRVKVDQEKEEKILEDLEKGLSGKEIAEKYNISQPTVSQIKKKHEDWTSYPVYIKLEHVRMQRMLNIAFMGRLLKKARIEFKEKGAIIRNSADKKRPFVYAVFPKKFFIDYKVKEPFDAYVASDILTILSDIEVDVIEVVLLDSKTWKIRSGGHEKSCAYGEIDWRDFDFPLPNLELDQDGIPKSVDAKAQTGRHALPAGEKEGKLNLEMKDGQLTASFKCHYGWDCKRIVDVKFLEKRSDALAIVDFSVFNVALRLVSLGWVGMWKDHDALAIGYGCVDWKECYIF